MRKGHKFELSKVKSTVPYTYKYVKTLLFGKLYFCMGQSSNF